MRARKSNSERFDLIKADVESGWFYFQENYKRFNEFVRFVFKTTLSPADSSVNLELDRPNMEFNVLEAFISRLCGEFSKMDAAFSVRAKEGVKMIDPNVITLVEGHLKAAFKSGSTNELSYHLYRNMLSGGFDVAKIYTDWAHEKSFDQNIYIEPVFDPTLTVFDPLARKSHKGDGRFACEVFPKSMEEAKDLYGSDVVKNIKFTRNASFEGFNWSYQNQKEEIMLFCEVFKKRMKKTKILKLANGHVVTEKDYEKFMERWEQSDTLLQAPIVIKSRITDICTIDKYTITERRIEKYEETSFSMLPLVFFDGNSRIVRKETNGQSEQVIRPYIYNARDTQRMKNFAGQALCNEMENSVQHKWIAPVEGIPANEAYQEAYTSPQKSQVVLYNAFKDGDFNQPINPPREIVRAPIPPEFTNTFTLADNTMQVILGSYDAALGVNDNDISGIAIMQGAMHSNAAAMPYITGFMHGWARCAEIYLDLLPKYYVTPRTIPVISPEGKREYYEINKNGNMRFDYDVCALEVEIQPGVNYEVQKQIALKTIISLMSQSDSFKEFINQNGLLVLLDNIDIRGIENLRYKVEEWMEQQKKLAQQAQEQRKNQLTPEQVAMAQVKVGADQVQMEREASQLKQQVEIIKTNAKSAVENKEADIKFIEVMSKVNNDSLSTALEQEKVDSENARNAIEMTTALGEHLVNLSEIEQQPPPEGMQQ